MKRKYSLRKHEDSPRDENELPKRAKPNNNYGTEQIESNKINLEDKTYHIVYLDLNLSTPSAFKKKMAVKRENASQEFEQVKKCFDSIKFLQYRNEIRRELFESGIDMIKERYQFGKLMYSYFSENKSKLSEFKLERLFSLVDVLKLWESKAFAAAMASKCDRTLQLVPEHIKQEKYIVNIAINSFGHALQYASLKLLRDKSFAFTTFQKHPDLLIHFNLNNSLQFLKQIATIDGLAALNYASEEIKHDRDFAMKLLIYNPNLGKRREMSLRFANDKYFILELALNCGKFALNFASKVLKDDKEVVLTAVRSDGLALQFASDKLRSDIQVVSTAVSDNGLALQYASDSLQSNRAVVMEAISENGLALEFASFGLRSDPVVVTKAAKNNIEALKFASSKVFQNRDLALVIFKINAKIALHYLPYIFKCDKQFLMEIATFDGVATLKFAKEQMTLDRDLVMTAVINDGSALQYAPHFHSDKELVKLAESDLFFLY